MTYWEIILSAVAVGFFLALLAVIGEQDRALAVLEAQHTCDMVAAGAWPVEYAESKSINCEEVGQ